MATGLPTEPTELLLMVPVPDWPAWPIRPPAACVVLDVLTGVVLRTAFRLVVPPATPVSAPAKPVPTTLPPLSVRLRMSALKAVANSPTLAAVRLMVKPATVLPRPSKRPLNELVALVLAVLSLAIGLKSAIDDRSMLAPSA